MMKKLCKYNKFKDFNHFISLKKSIFLYMSWVYLIIFFMISKKNINYLNIPKMWWKFHHSYKYNFLYLFIQHFIIFFRIIIWKNNSTHVLTFILKYYTCFNDHKFLQTLLKRNLWKIKSDPFFSIKKIQ